MPGRQICRHRISYDSDNRAICAVKKGFHSLKCEWRRGKSDSCKVSRLNGHSNWRSCETRWGDVESSVCKNYGSHSVGWSARCQPIGRFIPLIGYIPLHANEDICEMLCFARMIGVEAVGFHWLRLNLLTMFLYLRCLHKPQPGIGWGFFQWQLKLLAVSFI